MEGAPMEIIPLGPGFGVELRGTTLAAIAVDDAANAATRAAFEEHSVLVLRGQEVSDEVQLAFSRRFGPLETTKVGSQAVGTHLMILSTIVESGKVVPAEHRLQMRNRANQLWHTDSTFKTVPALASVLSARIIPDHGGETEFVSTRGAFERLDPALRQQCWRLVWKNPANGRGALYIASHACAIEGMELAAGRALLEELMAAATAPGLSYTHARRKGDVVMWDNRAT